MPKNSGFTLIELLVTITIISILTALGLVSYQLILKNSRDAKRQSDLKLIQSALEQYHADQFFYPSSITFGGSLTSSTGNPSPPAVVKTYLNVVPTDPLPSNPQYLYEATKAFVGACDNTAASRCDTYCLYAKLENATAPDTPCVVNSLRNLEVTKP